MITFVRTANFHDGKAPAAFAWAVKVATYINENVGMNVQVVRNVSGMVNQVHWMSTFESLADFDASTKKMQNDSGFQELFAEAVKDGLFVASSVVDSLYETIA